MINISCDTIAYMIHLSFHYCIRDTMLTSIGQLCIGTKGEGIVYITHV